MKNITVSTLPNITFYSGEDAEYCGEAVENRNYGVHSDIFGDLSRTSNYNSYWSYFSSRTFTENPTNYTNIGDILSSTVSYLNKFKDNNININIDKNILTFNYNYEDDLNSDYENTKVIPASDIINLLLSVNDMRFNKMNYYKNNLELKEVSYAHKKYPYRPEGTIYTVNENDNLVDYDFSRQFVDYNYTELSYDVAYEGHIMREIELEDGTISYIPTDITYTGYKTFYSYLLSDINKFDIRMENYFEDNSNKVEEDYADLKTYFISELDTMMVLSLNTMSLGPKNIYAYFNFDSKYSNWFDNTITFNLNTSELSVNDTLANVTPISENYFNILINENSKPCGEDIKINESTDINITDLLELEENQLFKIINPSYISKLDLSPINDKITTLNLINNYEKKINSVNTKTSNWYTEKGLNLKSLIIGSDRESTLDNLYGINNIDILEELNIKNCPEIESINISNLSNLKILELAGTNIKTIIPHSNNHFEKLSLPESLTSLILNRNIIDEFDYSPTSNLINLTLNNVSGNGFNSQSFINTWIDELENNTIKNSNNEDISVLYSGVVQNTTLLGINWENEPVDKLLKIKYLGINKDNINDKLTGTISIKGSNDNDMLNRKEYLNLRNFFGDDIMRCNGKINTSNLNLEYVFDISSLNKITKYYFYISQTYNGITTENKYQYIDNGKSEFNMNILDSNGGHSFLDYIDKLISNGASSLIFTKRTDNIGYELDLPEDVYINTNNSDSNSLTKTVSPGDILVYKRKKIIIATVQRTTIYNYTKIGTYEVRSNQGDKIEIEFI